MDTREPGTFWTNKHRGLLQVGLLLMVPWAVGCGGARQTKISNPVARIGAVEEGIASWYGEPYHGRRAANGEVYDMEQMTAAHPSLPFETWVSVRNPGNRESTQVRIIDRGPFVKGRIIDLSRAAAREIDLVRLGVAKVKLTVIEQPGSYGRGKQFTVQVTTARTRLNAEQLERQLRKSYDAVTIRYRAPVAKGNTPESWRLLVGRVKDIKQAQKILVEVRPKFPNSFVIGWEVD